MHANQADFFQPGHTYQSAHIRMGESVWLFHCAEVARRHNGDRVAQGPGYWGDVSGKATTSTGRMTVTYMPDSWSGGWIDITTTTSSEATQSSNKDTTVLESLPHDDYMTAVADALAGYGITVTDGGTSTPDGQLLDGWINVDPSSISVDQWPHGVYLGWDQTRGWLLIEQGGGRNVDPLDPTAVHTYSSPQQVACSAANALRGRLATGPITNDGTWSWDPRPLQEAVRAWASDES